METSFFFQKKKYCLILQIKYLENEINMSFILKQARKINLFIHVSLTFLAGGCSFLFYPEPVNAHKKEGKRHKKY